MYGADVDGRGVGVACDVRALSLSLSASLRDLRERSLKSLVWVEAPSQHGERDLLL